MPPISARCLPRWGLHDRLLRSSCEIGKYTSGNPSMEPISGSLHLLCKPWESTLSREKLFIETAMAKYFHAFLVIFNQSRAMIIRHTLGQARFEITALTVAVASAEINRMIFLIFCRVRNIFLKPSSKRKCWYTRTRSSSLLVILTVGYIF